MSMSVENYIVYLDEINRRLDACDTLRVENDSELRSYFADIDYNLSILSDDPLRYCTENERYEIMRQCVVVAQPI